MTKKVFRLSGLHCTSCNLIIEGELEDQLGVDASCSYQSQTVEVTFDSNKVSDEKIVSTIESQGYKVVGSD